MSIPWHPEARHRLTTRATSGQLIRWGIEAQRHGMSKAQFVAQAADFYALFLKSLRDSKIAEGGQGETEEPTW